MDTQLGAVCAALDFIEVHLRKEITVAEIAASAGYSLYHFIRIFNQNVQHSPYDYLMRRRLTEAARELSATTRRVLDVGVEFSFNNHETFSRAFRRMFDVAPAAWRNGENGNRPLALPRLSLQYLLHINHEDFSRPALSQINGVSHVRFVHGGDQSDLPLTVSYINHTWLPQASVRLAHFSHEADFVDGVALIPIKV